MGKTVTYSIRLAAEAPMICDCFIDVQPEVAQQFLVQMSTAQPLFGFACLPAEREHRNLISFQFGINKIEKWVGRNAEQNVPGLYWLTLLSETLLKRHGVPLGAIEAVAKEHIALEGGQHLFRFYERPEDWQTSSSIGELCASLPGVFNVEAAKAKVMSANSVLEANAMLRNWK
jgi:hypothetical protein